MLIEHHAFSLNVLINLFLFTIYNLLNRFEGMMPGSSVRCDPCYDTRQPVTCPDIGASLTLTLVLSGIASILTSLESLT